MQPISFGLCFRRLGLIERRTPASEQFNLAAALRAIARAQS
jgi:hypothetical protein